LRRHGANVALLAFGALVPAAEQVGEALGLTVVNMRFVKPLDRTLLLELTKTHEGFVTLEDNVVAGGAGSGVAELLAEAGLDADGIRAAVLRRWPQLGASPTRSAAV
jgi:1-deoxy-D-xylulose-5-phosphate synthase